MVINVPGVNQQLWWGGLWSDVVADRQAGVGDGGLFELHIRTVLEHLSHRPQTGTDLRFDAIVRSSKWR